MSGNPTQSGTDFEFTIKVKAKSKGTLPTFVGPFIQGPPGERFVYLDIGTKRRPNEHSLEASVASALELLHLLKVIQVCKKELRLMWKLAKVRVRQSI